MTSIVTPFLAPHGSPAIPVPGLATASHSLLEPQVTLPEPQVTLSQLAQQLRTIEVAGRKPWQGQIISSGCKAIDDCLPDGGYAAGSLVEWIADEAGSGIALLALTTARQAMRNGKYLLVIDRERRFYPPAALAMGIAMEQLIVIHPERLDDLHWAIDQGLRCSAIGAVLAHIERIDDRVARRLQLAAEEGGTLGLFLRRSKTALPTPSWAEVQWHVTPQADSRLGNHRCWDLHLQRCRGGRAGTRLTLKMDGSTLTQTTSSHHAAPFPQERCRNGNPVTSTNPSTLCLAAELALSTDASTRAHLGRPSLRAASA